MNTILEHLTGMHHMTDDVIAMDFLLMAKTGVRNYAMAVTETATPEIKAVLRKQLDEAVLIHARISDYLTAKGLYHPHHVPEQLQQDLKLIQTALSVPPTA